VTLQASQVGTGDYASAAESVENIDANFERVTVTDNATSKMRIVRAAIKVN